MVLASPADNCFPSNKENEAAGERTQEERSSLLNELSVLKAKFQQLKESGGPHDSLASTIHQIGVAEYRLGNRSEAIRLLTSFCNENVVSSLNFREAHATLHMLIGTINFADGDYKASVKHYKRAATLNKEAIRAWESLALTYRELGKFQKAATSYEECNKLLPESSTHMVALAVTLLDAFCADASASGHVRESESTLKRSPVCPAEGRKNLLRDQLYAGHVNGRIGIQEVEREDKTDAERFEKEKLKVTKRPLELLYHALDVAPTDANAQAALAQALYFVGKKKEALKLWQNYSSRLPDDINARNSLIALQIELGYLTEANGELEYILSKETLTAETYVNACALHSKLGRKKETLIWFRKVLDTLPDDLHTHSAAGAHLVQCGMETEVMQAYSDFVKRNPHCEAAKFYRYTFDVTADTSGRCTSITIAALVILLLVCFVWWTSAYSILLDWLAPVAKRLFSSILKLYNPETSSIPPDLHENVTNKLGDEL